MDFLVNNYLGSAMERDKILKIVEAALDRLVDEHLTLLDLDVTERALSHHLALYISQLVPHDYNVDVEYNRHNADPKRLNLPPRMALDRELRATTVFPDIIVHKRGTDENNLLVLEMKNPGEAMTYDERKLCAFRRELGYEHAAHIAIGKDNGSIVRNVIWVDG